MIDVRPSRWDWRRLLFARGAPIVLGVAAALSIGAIILIYSQPSASTAVGQAILGIGGAAAAFGLFALWVPMWFFWLRCDNQQRWRKAIWFFLLLFGISFGAVPYYAMVYLPAVVRHRRGIVDSPGSNRSSTQSLTLKIGLGGKALIAGWGLLLLTVTALFTFPKGMSHLLHPVAGYFVLWPVSLLIATFTYGVGLVLRIGLHRD